MAISRVVLGKRLKAAREKKGYKQAYIAAVVELSPYQISRIENGARSIYIDTLSAWCDLLEVSMVEILAEAETTEHSAYGKMFEEIADDCTETTVAAMLDACRAIAQVEKSAREKK